MKTIDYTELGNDLPTLPDTLGPGEDVSIVKDGEEFARITPVVPRKQREAAQAAFQQIRALAEKLKLGAFDWEEYNKDRDFGRR